MTGYSTALITFAITQAVCLIVGVEMYRQGFGLNGWVLFVFFELAAIFASAVPFCEERNGRKEGRVRRIPPSIIDD